MRVSRKQIVTDLKITRGTNQIRSFEFFSGIPCKKKKARKSCCRNNNTSSRVLTAVGCWQPPAAGSPRVLAACTGAPRVLATPAFGDRVLAPARCSCWLAREMFRLLLGLEMRRGLHHAARLHPRLQPGQTLISVSMSSCTQEPMRQCFNQ